MMETQVIQNEAMEAMILSKPAWPITRRHEEGRSFMIKIWVFHQFDHIPCGQDTGITLFSRGQFPTPIEGIFIRFRKDICLHSTGLESSCHSKGVVTHVRDIH